jgi:hypothetical protein
LQNNLKAGQAEVLLVDDTFEFKGQKGVEVKQKILDKSLTHRNVKPETFKFDKVFQPSDT